MVRLTRDPIRPEEWALSGDPARGGFVLFLGTVRGVTDGVETLHLEYTAYEGMALREMGRIAEEARSRFGAEVVMIHRLGVLRPGEAAVLTAAYTPHRAEAFECCRFLIDSLKQDVPIWKKEVRRDGSTWVEGGRSVPAESGE